MNRSNTIPGFLRGIWHYGDVLFFLYFFKVRKNGVSASSWLLKANVACNHADRPSGKEGAAMLRNTNFAFLFVDHWLLQRVYGTDLLCWHPTAVHCQTSTGQERRVQGLLTEALYASLWMQMMLHYVSISNSILNLTGPPLSSRYARPGNLVRIQGGNIIPAACFSSWNAWQKACKKTLPGRSTRSVSSAPWWFEAFAANTCTTTRSPEVDLQNQAFLARGFLVLLMRFERETGKLICWWQPWMTHYPPANDPKIDKFSLPAKCTWDTVS